MKGGHHDYYDDSKYKYLRIYKRGRGLWNSIVGHNPIPRQLKRTASLDT